MWPLSSRLRPVRRPAKRAIELRAPGEAEPLGHLAPPAVELARLGLPELDLGAGGLQQSPRGAPAARASPRAGSSGSPRVVVSKRISSLTRARRARRQRSSIAAASRASPLMRSLPSPRPSAGSPRAPTCSSCDLYSKNSGVERISNVRGRSIPIRSSSLIRPGRAVITSTRSERKTASSMSWVTNMTVSRCSSQTLVSSSCMSWRVWASSAPNGSSISSTSGL